MDQRKKENDVSKEEEENERKEKEEEEEKKPVPIFQELTLYPDEVNKHHEKLEKLFLSKVYTRKKILAEAEKEFLQLLTKMLLLIIFRKRDCSNQVSKKKLFYRRKFIMNKLGSQKGIDCLMKSKTKLRKFWLRIQTLLSDILACYMERVDPANNEKKKEEIQ